MEEHLHIKPTLDERKATVIQHESKTGTLAAPIETAEWSISGGITTAVDCFLNRAEVIEKNSAHFTVDTADFAISLMENENRKLIRKTYVGTLKPSAEIKALQINEELPTSLPDMKKLLKRHRHLFADDEAFLKLLVALDNPSLSTTISSEVSKDNRGNASETHVVKNNSNNVPVDFAMRIPLFAGDLVTFANVKVNMCFKHENAQKAVFWLESFDLQKQQIEAARTLMDAEIARLKDQKGVPAIIYK